MKAISKHIGANLDTRQFSKLGLEKKKHRFNIKFEVNEKAKVSGIIVEHQNKDVIKIVKEIFKRFKIRYPGYNNGKEVNVKYTIPMSFVIE